MPGDLSSGIQFGKNQLQASNCHTGDKHTGSSFFWWHVQTERAVGDGSVVQGSNTPTATSACIAKSVSYFEMGLFGAFSRAVYA